MNCCTREENWACMAGGSSEMLSGAFASKLLGGGKELLFDADADGGVVEEVVDGGVVVEVVDGGVVLEAAALLAGECSAS